MGSRRSVLGLEKLVKNDEAIERILNWFDLRSFPCESYSTRKIFCDVSADLRGMDVSDEAHLETVSVSSEDESSPS